MFSYEILWCDINLLNTYGRLNPHVFTPLYVKVVDVITSEVVLIPLRNILMVRGAFSFFCWFSMYVSFSLY